MFAALAGDFSPLTVDTSGGSTRHAPPALLVAMAVGLGSIDMPIPDVASWEWVNWKFPKSVRAGETIYARWTLTQKRPPVHGAPAAIVVWRVDVHTADGAVCAEGEVGASVFRRAAAPAEKAAEPAGGPPRRRRRRRGTGPGEVADAPVAKAAAPPPASATPAHPEKSPSSRRRRRKRSGGSGAAGNGNGGDHSGPAPVAAPPEPRATTAPGAAAAAAAKPAAAGGGPSGRLSRVMRRLRGT